LVSNASIRQQSTLLLAHVVPTPTGEHKPLRAVTGPGREQGPLVNSGRIEGQVKPDALVGVGFEEVRVLRGKAFKAR
jgi:hypothetical protein